MMSGDMKGLRCLNRLLNHRDTSEGPLGTEMETEHLRGELARFTNETELRGLIEEADGEKEPFKTVCGASGETQTESSLLQGPSGSFRDVQIYEPAGFLRQKSVTSSAQNSDVSPISESRVVKRFISC